MKNFILKQALALLFVSSIVFNAHAQFSNIINKVKQKATDKVNSAFDSKPTTAETKPGGKKISINQSFDFVACDSLVFDDNFSSYAIGKMPATWKTNGSGEIVKSPELSGKWLKLQDFASYKIAKLIKYPSKFTIEFDVVAVADKIADLDPLSFGFAGDNSVRGYLQDAYNDGAVSNIELQYYNNRGITAASSDTKYSHTSEEVDLQGFTNQLMHVSITVDGQNEQVYLDKTKISDTKMFNPNRLKYFYISAPLHSRNGAKVLFGNFKMMACK